MSVFGVVLSVSTRVFGSALEADAPAGVVSLTVSDPLDFAAAGGTLLVGEQTLTYTAVDYTTGVLALAAATTVARAEGDRVELVPRTVEKRAEVAQDGSGEPITATVPHALTDVHALRDGIRASNAREPVTLRRLGDGSYEVANVEGVPLLRDGSYLDPATLPATPTATDGLPPASSPALVVVPAIGAIAFGWAPVANPDSVTYALHVSAVPGFAVSAATRFSAGASSPTWVRTLPDGTPLAQDTTYFARLVASDADGSAAPSPEVSGQLAKVNSPDIAANAVTTAHLVANAVTAEKLSAVLVLASLIASALTGQRWEGDVDGIRGYRADGSVFFNMAPAQALVLADGLFRAINLTVTGGASLGGVTEVAKGGALRLTKGTTAPANAPTVTLDYPNLRFTDDGKWGDRSGWATDGTYWYTARVVSGLAWVEKWSAGGTLVASMNTTFAADRWLGGVAVSGGSVFLVTSYTGLGIVFNRVVRVSPDASGYLDFADWPGANGDRVPAIGVDPATGELLIAQSRTSDDKVRIRRYTYTNAPAGSITATLTAGTFVDTAATDIGDLAGVAYGSFDLGANRYVYAKRSGVANQTVRVLDTAGVRQPAQEWLTGAGAGAAKGFTWDGAAFRSIDLAGRQRTYTGIQLDTIYFSSTLRSATAETDQSPRAMLTGTRRTRATVTTSSIETTGDPNDPNAVSIYAGTATTRLNMWRQSAPANTVTTVALTTIATTGVNPPLTNGFGSGIPAVLQTWDAQTMIDAVGAIPASPFRNSVDARVTLQTHPEWSCLVSRAAAQTLVTNTDTAIAFDTEGEDASNIHAAGLFTVPAGTGGVWRMTASVTYAASGTGRRIFGMNRNSSVGVGTNNLLSVIAASAATSAATAVALPWEGRLVAGDVVRLWGFQNSGANLDISNAQAAFAWVRP